MMAETAEQIITLLTTPLLILSLMIVGQSRIGASIRLYTFQSTNLALLCFAVGYFEQEFSLYWVGLLTLVIKVVLIPTVLLYIVNKIKVAREVEQLIGAPSSLIISAALIGLSYYTTHPILKDLSVITKDCLPVSIALVLIGLLIMIGRKKAVMQIVGLLIMENGIFLAALATTLGMPLAVELGIFFDLLVGALIMGILVYHINQTFETIDVDKLTRLKG
jgi:hydrogenase-4 component E